MSLKLSAFAVISLKISLISFKSSIIGKKSSFLAIWSYYSWLMSIALFFAILAFSSGLVKRLDFIDK